MLKKIAAFITAAAAAFCCCSCMKFEKTVEKRNEVDVPPKMVFMGDSIAAGYGLEGYTADDNYNCRSYSNILKDEYTDELKNSCGHEMVNVAVSGDTSTQLLEHLNSGEFDTALKDSDAVVISIGGNDILEIFLQFMADNLGFIQEESSFDISDINLLSLASAFSSMDKDIDTALDGFEVNIKEIAQTLRSKTNGTIYVQTLYDPMEYFDKVEILVDFADEKIGRLNKIIADNASYGQKEYYKVIDVAPEFVGKCGDVTTIKQYDIHPNAEGHEIIARTVDNALRKNKFYYTTTETVKDQKAINKLIIICIAGGAVVIVLIVIAVIAVKRSHKTKG